MALAYLDDIIIYGASHLECIQRLAIVFKRLQAAGLKLKPSKCALFEPETLYLGHIVSAQGVSCDPAKVSAVAEWRPPTNYKQVQVFLGTVNYYNRFIKDFSKIAYPLRRIARDKRSFVWTDECQRAFETLKQSLVSAPIAKADASVSSMYNPSSSGYAMTGAETKLCFNVSNAR